MGRDADMRGNLTLSSRQTTTSMNITRGPSSTAQIPPNAIPSIRLISATPSTTATGISSSSEFSESSADFHKSLEESWASASAPPLPLPPHALENATANPPNTVLTPKLRPSDSRKRLVPKKSKLSLPLLASATSAITRTSSQEKANDFSDVVRRVGVGKDAARAASLKLKGGFEIYVDPTPDPDMADIDIVMVKKKKSRAGLDGMRWGGGSEGGRLGEVTNVPKGANVKEGAKDKLKADEKEKGGWWSIGRGRKDSKEKEKEKENRKEKWKPVEYIHVHPEEPARSKTPEPFKNTDTASRGRFNSLDAGILLSSKPNPKSTTAPTPTRSQSALASPPPPPPAHLQFAEPPKPKSSLPPSSRSATPTLSTIGGMLAPPLLHPSVGQTKDNQGSIALRAIRSVRSLARMGNWAQMTGEEEAGGTIREKKEKPKKKDKEEKELKDGKKVKKTKKEKTEGSGEGEEKGKKEKKKSKKDKASTVRISTSSFEVGGLSASPGSLKAELKPEKKRSILGLGLPSTMRLPNVRSGSTASSIGNINIGVVPPSASTAGIISPPATLSNRLSADSARDARPSSIISSGSSLRPLSSTSTMSRLSSGSSVSVRWDEQGLKTVKEQRTKERGERRSSKDSGTSRHSLEGRKRTPLTLVFPDLAEQQEGEVRDVDRLEEGERDSVADSMSVTSSTRVRRAGYPIFTVEEATNDGHGSLDDESLRGFGAEIAATPMKKARARPLSEQLLGKSRPKPMYEEEEGVLSILDAATHDLALLINNLDLQATPGATPNTPDISPRKPIPLDRLARPQDVDVGLLVVDSPLKKSQTKNEPQGQTAGLTLRSSVASISSLRPYAQSRKYAANSNSTSNGENNNTIRPLLTKKKPSITDIIGQQIAPWPVTLSPLKEKEKLSFSPSSSTKQPPPSSPPPTFRRGHRRTMTPAPEPEPEPTFEPLRPARLRPAAAAVVTLRASRSKSKSPMDGVFEIERAPSSLTFGSSSVSSRVSDSKDVDMEIEAEARASGSLTPVFKRMQETEKERSTMQRFDQKSSSLRPSASPSPTYPHSPAQDDSFSISVPLPRETRRVLGMSGTMGGSDVSLYQGPLPDVDDPDSDVPDELRFLLAGSTDSRAESLSFVEGDDEGVMGSLGSECEFEEEDEQEGEREDVEMPRSQYADLKPPMFSLPPSLPVFRASLIDAEHNLHLNLDDADITTSTSTCEDSTKKSFDFTGELRKLNESGALDRRSFVEQLENAFRTPAKVDLRYGFLGVAPPVPKMPELLAAQMQEEEEESVDMGGYDGGEEMLVDEITPSSVGMDSTQPPPASASTSLDVFPSEEQIVDIAAPSMLLVPEDSTRDVVLSLRKSTDRLRSPAVSTSSRPSDGQLDRSFKFGGLPRSGSDSRSLCSSTASRERKETEEEEKPLTLSDIIPPLSRVREVSMASSDENSSDMMDEDDSVLKSIYAKLTAMPMGVGEAIPLALPLPAARPRLPSNVNATTDPNAIPPLNPRPHPTQAEEQVIHKDSRRSVYKGPSRPASGISFTGFDSFDEVRRGFEFSGERQFYPPPGAAAANTNTSFEFSFSLASTGNVNPASGFYPPSSAFGGAAGATRRTQRQNHRRHESVFSIASVSSYGHVLNGGAADPFDYGLPTLHSLRERPSSEDMSMSRVSVSSISMSMEVDDTFAYLAERNGRRTRVESDASSFYFKPARGHKRRESNMSVSSIAAPPISMYNTSNSRGHAQHRKTDSSASASSVAMSYIKHGANGGFQAWNRQHKRDFSVDSVLSEGSFSVGHGGRDLGRPGLGDKMFDMQDGQFLESIEASPRESLRSPEFRIVADSISTANTSENSNSNTDGPSDVTSNMPAHRSTYDNPDHTSAAYAYDSIMDDHRSSAGYDDSLFEQTGHRNSASSDSVFGDDEGMGMDGGYGGGRAAHGGLLPPNQFRPLSVLSLCSVHSPTKDDDTMISMLGGGGHVRRRSIEASPCVRVEKRKHAAAIERGYASPNKARIVEKPSISSTSSCHFGGERMIRAQHGLLERQSLEDSCLIADGEELAVAYCSVPVFSRPNPSARSRSSTCTESSGIDTPPLSASDGSSVSEPSPQSSLDLSHLNMALSNATHPMSSVARNRARARARGAGHRRRYSKAHISGSSVYETIEEEAGSNSSSPASSLSSSLSSSVNKEHGNTPTTTTRQAIFIVDSDTGSLAGDGDGNLGSVEETAFWDDERGIVALRKYYALRDEAESTVTESKRVWSDTPFSLFAVQSFEPPDHASGMQALLQHSVQNYGPLPSELRPRRIRSRTSSRPSPYPQHRISKTTLSPESLPAWALPSTAATSGMPDSTPTITARINVLQQVPFDQNVDHNPHLNSNSKSRSKSNSSLKLKSDRKKKTPATKAPPALEALKPFSPLVLDVVEPKRENAFGLAPNARPRISSNARRTALGWTKRSTGAGAKGENANGKSSTGPSRSNGQKENVVAMGSGTGTGGLMTPGETLRLNRPRARGRATPASAVRPIRI